MNGETAIGTIKLTCPGCGQKLEMPLATDAHMLPCPTCGTEVPLPKPAPLTQEGAQQALCAICQSPMTADEPRTACPECRAEYHLDCWQENGGCAVYGCGQVPATEGRASVEVPVGYWGQEHKVCPVCNAQILAAAVRCRECGAVFQSARPLDSAEFSRATAQELQAPSLKRKLLLLFVLCVFPFTAPIAAIAGLIWLQSQRENVRELPAMFGALGKIGVGVGLFQTAAIVLLSILFALLRS